MQDDIYIELEEYKTSLNDEAGNEYIGTIQARAHISKSASVVDCNPARTLYQVIMEYKTDNSEFWDSSEGLEERLFLTKEEMYKLGEGLVKASKLLDF